ncbi:hypothetical protein BOX15_Mlig022800g2 [Macrostomum lignano]|uniref:Uncharacterized protein n=1 Tax=Macrostomum lignano TaxID=282301 RepID=A0A267GN28_9PLAT|nr:hypothetical protein BOX15_Mlig022800g2 [Macrostomum lignano]
MSRTKLLIRLATLFAAFAVDFSGAISCYSRDKSTGRANGTVSNCTSDSACYRYTADEVSYAGCGTCSAADTRDYNCESCTADYCNTWPPLTGCLYAKGEYRKEKWVKVSCSQASCYQFSYGYGPTIFFFAGCGDCADYGNFDNCKTCATDYCNSAKVLTAEQTNLMLTAAGGLLVMVMQLWGHG